MIDKLMNFGMKIAKLRERKGLSQKEMIEKIGPHILSFKTLQNYEQGRTYPDLDKLITLSNFFGCTIDDLLDGNLIEKHEHTYKDAYRALSLLLDKFTLIPLTFDDRFNMFKNKITFLSIDPNITLFIKKYIVTLEVQNHNKDNKPFDYFKTLEIADELNGQETIQTIDVFLKEIIKNLKK